VFVKLPEEDHEEGMCGRLVKAMYGTRDAAQNWEYEYVDFMKGAGFVQGKANPCMFYHPGRNIRAVVHGDDFTLTGFDEDLDWYRKKIAERFDVKFRARLGEDQWDDKSVRILNRIVTWEDGVGLRYEPDQRHAELIAKGLGLDETSKVVQTPGTKEVTGEAKDFEPTKYRMFVARANYLAQDRVDIQFAVKELCRKMSSPEARDWQALKRLGRYLVGEPRKVTYYDFQEVSDEVTIWTDSDFA
jgi:hypothetical protein